MLILRNQQFSGTTARHRILCASFSVVTIQVPFGNLKVGGA